MKRFSTSGLNPRRGLDLIILPRRFLSTQHPSSYEMVRPSARSAKQLLITCIRVWCGRTAYFVMWHNCPDRCSRPIGMKKLSYTHRCKLACHAHVITLFTGVISSEWINCLRYLWMYVKAPLASLSDEYACYIRNHYYYIVGDCLENWLPVNCLVWNALT